MFFVFILLVSASFAQSVPPVKDSMREDGIDIYESDTEVEEVICSEQEMGRIITKHLLNLWDKYEKTTYKNVHVEYRTACDTLLWMPKPRTCNNKTHFRRQSNTSLEGFIRWLRKKHK